MRRYLGSVLVGTVVGFVIVPVLAPTLSRMLRPVVRSGIKTGIFAYDSTRTRLAELSETLQDLTAEARSKP